jgi:hypothetical protein
LCLHRRLFDTTREAWRRSAFLAIVGYSAISWSFSTLAVAAKHLMSSVSEYFWIETAYTLVQFASVAPLMALV